MRYEKISLDAENPQVCLEVYAADPVGRILPLHSG